MVIRPEVAASIGGPVDGSLGLFFANSISLFGIFLFQSHRLPYFVVGLLCILQFIPIGLFRREEVSPILKQHEAA